MVTRRYCDVCGNEILRTGLMITIQIDRPNADSRVLDFDTVACLKTKVDEVTRTEQVPASKKAATRKRSR